MYEHIEIQLLGAAAYGVYALIRLSPRFDTWSKRRTLLLGYAPALLAGAVFLSQILLELALLDGGKALPTALAGVYQAFYANWVLFAMLSGLVATGYLLLHGSALLAVRTAARPKRRRKGRFGIRSDEDCIDALDESADYLRRKRRNKNARGNGLGRSSDSDEDDWVYYYEWDYDAK